MQDFHPENNKIAGQTDVTGGKVQRFSESLPWTPTMCIISEK